MTNKSRKYFLRYISIAVLLLGMVIFGVAQQAGATAFDLSVVSGNPLTISGNSLIGALSITNGALAGNYLNFNASLSDAVVTPDGSTTTYNIGGTFTLVDDLGTLTGTFTSAKLVSSDTTIGVVYYLLGLSTTNAYYNGTIDNDSGLGALFGLSGGNTTFNGGTLTFSQNTISNTNPLVFFGNGSLTSGTGTSTVPVPPSFLLLGTGLAGFVVLRRKISKK